MLTSPLQLDWPKKERCFNGEEAAAGVVKGSHNSEVPEGWTGKQMNDCKMCIAWFNVNR